MFSGIFKLASVETTSEFVEAAGRRCRRQSSSAGRTCRSVEAPNQAGFQGMLCTQQASYPTEGFWRQIFRIVHSRIEAVNEKMQK